MRSFYYNNLSIKDSILLFFEAIWNLFLIRRLIDYKSKFEIDFKNIFKLNYVLAVPSARSAIFLILESLNLKEGDEIIVTGLTCSAVIEPILLLKLKPVYTDINYDTLCQDIDSISRNITNKTKAIIIQHTFGMVGPLKEVQSVIKNKNIFLIEDCALALGSKLNDKFLGSFGDASVFSFELSKTISVGWGGILSINNKSKYELIKKNVHNHGYKDKYEISRNYLQSSFSNLIYNYYPANLKIYTIAFFYKIKLFKKSSDTKANDLRMPSDRQWKYLSIQLKNLSFIIDKRSSLINIILKNVNTNPNGVFKIYMPSDGVSLIRIPILVKDKFIFKKICQIYKLEVGEWFSDNVSDDKYSSQTFGYIPGTCVNAEIVANSIINLPINYRTTIKNATKLNTILIKIQNDIIKCVV